MPPLVSIVIPTYNRARDLERALASVRAQTVTDWEAVVVDNHSTDDTIEMLASLGDDRIRVFRVHNEGVIAVSRNKGIAEARGDIVAFLDSDDWWAPTKLERSIAALEAGADVVYHDLYLVRAAARKRPAPAGAARPLRPPVFEDLLRSGNALANSSVVVRAALLRAIGPLSENPDLIGMEDFDGWLRIARHTDRFVMLPETLGYYWLGTGNTTNPQRTLRALRAFEAIYPDVAPKGRTGTAWVDYMRGRALFRLGQYREARATLRRLSLTSLSPAVALKTGYMLLRSSFATGRSEPS